MAPAPASLTNSTQKPRDCPESSLRPVRSRSHKATRPQIVTREQLDMRTGAGKFFARMVAEIEHDLGGRDHLSTIQRSLIEGFVGAAITLHGLNVRLALGEAIDPGILSASISAMVRVASRLGLKRVPRDITPSVKDYVKHINEQEEADA